MSRYRSRDSMSKRSKSRRHRTTRRSSLRPTPVPTRAGDFQMEHAASEPARNAGRPDNTRDRIALVFPGGILLRERSADKQKSMSPVAGRQIRPGWQGRRFQPPSASLPDKVDSACIEKVRQRPALPSVERCRAQLQCANMPLPMYAMQRREKRATPRLRLRFGRTLQPVTHRVESRGQSNAAARR